MDLNYEIVEYKIQIICNVSNLDPNFKSLRDKIKIILNFKGTNYNLIFSFFNG